jgi:hypothetical protein
VAPGEAGKCRAAAPHTAEVTEEVKRPDGVYAVDARVKVTAYEPQDPFLRKLR